MSVTHVILFYLMIVGIILCSIVVSLIITYIVVNIILLIPERYAIYFRNNSQNKTGTKSNQTGDIISFIIFLKCIYYILHLNYIQLFLRYPFRKCNMNPYINTINSKPECKCNSEDNSGSPKPLFHEKTLPQENKAVNQKGTLPPPRMECSEKREHPPQNRL